MIKQWYIKQEIDGLKQRYQIHYEKRTIICWRGLAEANKCGTADPIGEKDSQSLIYGHRIKFKSVGLFEIEIVKERRGVGIISFFFLKKWNLRLIF